MIIIVKTSLIWNDFPRTYFIKNTLKEIIFRNGIIHNSRSTLDFFKKRIRQYQEKKLDEILSKKEFHQHMKEQLKQQIEGKVNDATWWFQDAGTWLLTSVTGTSDNSGVLVSVPTTWINRYEFQYRSGGWDPQVTYSDDLTGEPVPDPVADVGQITVETYESFDFTLLFPTPF